MTAIAQIFDGPGQPFRCEEFPLPVPGAGERLVALSLATLCGSDVHTVDGRRQEPTPAILGHEGIGRVVAAGAGVEADIGRRVTWSLADSCGHCRFCGDYNLPQKCDHLFKYGHAHLDDGSGLNGTYASHVLLRSGTHVVDVPSAVGDAIAAPANCALATAVAAVDVLPAGLERVLVQGAGLLGLYASALLKHRGIESVWCCDPIAARRQSIEQWDVEALTPQAATALSGCDAVLEVSGHAGGVADGVHSLRTGGTYVFVGMVHPDSQLPLTGEQVIRKCLQLRGVHNYQPRHLDEAVGFLESLGDDDRLRRLVSPPRSLTDLADAFEEARRQRWLRVSIAPELGNHT